MATVEEELSQLEKDIRQIKIEYEVFLGGGRKRPPNDIEWRIEQTIKRYSERGLRISGAQNFRFQGLLQTFIKYREMFRKRAKRMEEGTVVRHFGAAARQVEADRKRLESSKVGSSSVAARVAIGAHTDPARESLKTRKLYEAFKDSKERAGENTSKLTLDGFRDFLAKKSSELRGSDKESSVEFVVATEDGRVRLKARVHQLGKSKT